MHNYDIVDYGILPLQTSHDPINLILRDIKENIYRGWVPYGIPFTIETNTNRHHYTVKQSFLASARNRQKKRNENKRERHERMVSALSGEYTVESRNLSRRRESSEEPVVHTTWCQAYVKYKK